MVSLQQSPTFDEQMGKLNSAASRLKFLPDRRVDFRKMAEKHMLRFVQPGDLHKISQHQPTLEQCSAMLANKFLMWYGCQLWESRDSMYYPMSSAEEDPVLRRALLEYFYQLLQLPTLAGLEPDCTLRPFVMAC
jgi:hypothetical protein